VLWRFGFGSEEIPGPVIQTFEMLQSENFGKMKA
jgi:hypothetical protein